MLKLTLFCIHPRNGSTSITTKNRDHSDIDKICCFRAQTRDNCTGCFRCMCFLQDAIRRKDFYFKGYFLPIPKRLRDRMPWKPDSCGTCFWVSFQNDRSRGNYLENKGSVRCSFLQPAAYQNLNRKINKKIKTNGKQNGLKDIYV